jgi:hypothetical protein
MTIETVRLLRLAGFGLSALSGVPMSVALTQNPTLPGASSYQLWLACFVVFGAAFGLTGWRTPPSQRRWIHIASLVIQTSAALTMIRLVCSGQEGSLLVIGGRTTRLVAAAAGRARLDRRPGYGDVRHLVSEGASA